MTGAPAWTGHPDLVEFYATHRNRLEDLYPSERRFLPWLARRADSVLDVGCGAGGFAAVWRSYRPALRYTGVDLSASLVEAAREAHPGDEFIVADCADGLPFPPRAADVIAALGWLHWEPRYVWALEELWRVTRHHLFFDLRLSEDDVDIVGSQRLALTSEWDGHTTVPYICASWRRVAQVLLELGPTRILAHGYWGNPASTVSDVRAEVCFATFVLERGESPSLSRPRVAVELPLAWPEELAEAVDRIDGSALAELVPDAEGDGQ